MNKTILAVLICIPTLFLTGCVTETIYAPGYVSYPAYNGSYVSSTGYGVGDYGLGFGSDYNPHYGLLDFGAEH